MIELALVLFIAAAIAGVAGFGGSVGAASQAVALLGVGLLVASLLAFVWAAARGWRERQARRRRSKPSRKPARA